MFIDKISKRERLGLYLAAAFLLLVSFDRFIFSPINRKTAKLDQEIEINQRRLANDMRNIQQKDFIIRQYDRYKAYVKRAGSDEEETARVLGEIENLARQASVYLTNLKPRPVKETESYKRYSAEVEVEGDMSSITRFLYLLNSSLQLLRAEKVSLNRRDKDSAVVKASILVSKFLTP